MALQARRPEHHRLAALLDACRDQDLTYAPTGGSLGGAVPPGLRHRRWSTALEGPGAFDRGRAALGAWAAHRGAGLDVVADGPLTVGTNVALVAPLPIGFVEATCRVVAIVDEEQRFGFAYGTLPVHPETGEESFVVSRNEPGLVSFVVEAVSRPALFMARWAAPVADQLQDEAVRRYLVAMRRATAGGP